MICIVCIIEMKLIDSSFSTGGIINHYECPKCNVVREERLPHPVHANYWTTGKVHDN